MKREGKTLSLELLMKKRAWSIAQLRNAGHPLPSLPQASFDPSSKASSNRKPSWVSSHPS
jgi:hypothetical protein